MRFEKRWKNKSHSEINECKRRKGKIVYSKSRLYLDIGMHYLHSVTVYFIEINFLIYVPFFFFRVEVQVRG